MRNGRPILVLVLALVAVAGALPVRAGTIRGRVVDRSGRPVEFANVQVAALRRGTVTDSGGRFALALPDSAVELLVSQIGYQRARLLLPAEAGDAGRELRIVLTDEPIPVAEVTVTASSFGKAGKSEGAVVSRYDVLTTPGGAADVFQSLRTLPGINAPNEGAAVYVRGGDPGETLIRVDHGDIGHPYHYEGASGGLFSSIDTYLIKSAFFSSGGFSARYGGALSGVLDIELQDPMDLRTLTVGANLAGANASTSWALVPGKLSFIGSVMHTFPEILFRIYGSASSYVQPPSSVHGLGRLVWRPAPASRVTLSYYDSGDRIAVWADRLNARHTYGERARNQVVALNGSHVVGRSLVLRAHASGQLHDSRWSFGPFGAQETERGLQGNLEGVWSAGSRHELSFGANLRHRDTEIAGAFPADSVDLAEGAPTRVQLTDAQVGYPGFYLEDKLRLWGPLYATLGVRADRASVPGVWTVDPRAAIAWRVDAHQTLRVAAGRYHQLAAARYLDPVYGNPELAPLRADHVIAGWEWRSDAGNVRVEAYRKDYDDLVTVDPVTFYANGGYGYARGVDVFVQGGFRTLSGWVSYGWMDSRRRELDAPARVPSPYGVAHSMTLVGRWQATPAFQVGARWTATSGRPYTPVTGGAYDADRDVYRPVYGPDYSDEMPAYGRLDLRVTRLFSMPGWGAVPASGACAVYVEGLNVFDIGNVLDYVYNSDYSERYETESYFSRRLLVAGFSLTW